MAAEEERRSWGERGEDNEARGRMLEKQEDARGKKMENEEQKQEESSGKKENEVKKQEEARSGKKENEEERQSRLKASLSQVKDLTLYFKKIRKSLLFLSRKHQLLCIYVFYLNYVTAWLTII